MGCVYVLLADGFEEIEGLTVVDILRRGAVDTKMVSINETLQVTSARGIKVEADLLMEQTDVNHMDMLVLPGGMPGTTNLKKHPGVTAMICLADQAGKRIAAICAAPSILGEMDLLQGKRAVCYPGVEESLKGAEVLTDACVTDGLITTGRAMGTAIAFSLELLRLLKGKETADKIAESILFKN